MKKEKTVQPTSKSGNSTKTIVKRSLLSPKQVADKYSKEWAEPQMWQYAKCSDAQILAWGYREGYEAARRDLMGSNDA